MSIISREPSDTSVTFSLAELARIEAERVREEDVTRVKNAVRRPRRDHRTNQHAVIVIF